MNLSALHYSYVKLDDRKKCYDLGVIADLITVPVLYNPLFFLNIVIAA